MSTPATPTAAPVTTPAPAAAPAPAPATPPATPPSATPTPAAVTGAFFNHWRPPVKAKVAEPAPATPAPATPPAAAPAAPAPVAPAPAKPDGFDPNLPTPPRRQAQPDIQSIVKAAVTGAMEANRPTPPSKPSEPELPKSISRKLEKLDLLDGAEFKTIRKEAEDFYRLGGADDAYRSEWQKKHPGKKFVREAAEHDEFYAEHDPLERVGEDDWDEASDRLVTRRATEIARTTASETLSKRDQESKRGTAAQQATATIDRIFTKSVSSLSPELAELVKDPEKLNTLNVHNPLAAHVSVVAANQYVPVINGIEEIFSAGEKFDAKNPNHRAVDQVGVELEDLLSRSDPKLIRRGNRDFATMAEVMSMPVAERGKFWTIGREELLRYVESRQIEVAADLYKRLRDPQLAANGRQAQDVAPPPGQAPAAPIANSPSIGATAAAPPPGTQTGGGADPKPSGFFASIRG